ncbi:MAG: SPOR domain-containing protein [Lachnospiraceae bacterium]|nr:SPOR domain-containing protein [Lachnospiraceae bacterium]
MRNSGGKTALILLALILVCSLFSGCALAGKILGRALEKGKNGKEQTEETQKDEETKDPENAPEKETAEAGGAKEDGTGQDAGGKEDETTPGDDKNDPEGSLKSADEPKTLGEKLCGKYSLKISGDEYFILEIMRFGDNLYAGGGYAFDDHEEGMDRTLGAYSFYAMEFLPEEAEAFGRTDTEEAAIGVAGFSVMSNFGKYWGAPEKGTIRLDDNGVIFSGFPDSEFFVEEVLGKTLIRDARVENTFPYMNPEEAWFEDPPYPVEGIFREKGTTDPVWLDFPGRQNLRIYRKLPGEEVLLLGGAFTYDNDVINYEASIFGNGGAPETLNIEIRELDEDTLKVRFKDADHLFGDVIRVFEKKEEKDVPVVTVSDAEEAGLDEDYGLRKLYSEEFEENAEFYGVFVGAFKERNGAYEYLEKAKDSGFEADIVYSPDWTELNPEPYYCVTVSKNKTREEAEQILDKAKSAGFKDAYVRFSGKRTGKRVYYTMHSLSGVKVSADEVILRKVQVDDLSSVYLTSMDLVIDKDTVFDPSCETEFFGNYEEGDTPLSWFLKNEKYSREDPDRYMENGPALIGVFEVGLTGKHIDRFYNTYWWD